MEGVFFGAEGLGGTEAGFIDIQRRCMYCSAAE